MHLAKLHRTSPVSSRVRYTTILGLFFLILSLEISAQSTVLPKNKPAITLYGLAHYRLRGCFNSQTDTTDIKKTQSLYQHRIAYYAGIKAQVNSQLSLQLQIGNDWVNTEQVNYITNNNWNSAKGLFPYFHLAFGTWNPGPFNFSFGKIPVESFGPLDLLERSIATNTYGSGGPGYGATFLGWITGTHNSLIGLKVGVPILSELITFSTNITYAIVDGNTTLNSTRGQLLAEEPKRNPSAQLVVVDFPVQAGVLTSTPQAFYVFNRNYNRNTEKGDGEFGVGFAIAYKASRVSLRAKGAYASFSNKKSHTDFPVSDTVIRTIPEYSYTGIYGSIGVSIAAGPGTVHIDFAANSDENSKKDGSRVIYPYIDLKYGLSPIQNLEIIPRFRAFITLYDDSWALKSKVMLWPELILQAKF